MLYISDDLVGVHVHGKQGTGKIVSKLQKSLEQGKLSPSSKRAGNKENCLKAPKELETGKIASKLQKSWKQGKLPPNSKIAGNRENCLQTGSMRNKSTSRET